MGGDPDKDIFNQMVVSYAPFWRRSIRSAISDPLHPSPPFPLARDAKIPACEGAPEKTVIETGRAICYDGADSACEEEAR